ncbi:MAG: HAMP domain-containing histidine kinase [Intrasporangium sp.]|uniref:sensor histidine kinase n=1 Tax=Intrasporangium sp. TaxID=1925024 RepID=UPI00264796FE|nr:HAMP domain-containing sensor histidine kinase [Intrasporangium sp.]MDN5797385.1 HAMP domain-containing histidine kinase [Intrasporangium sp.]
MRRSLPSASVRARVTIGALLVVGLVLLVVGLVVVTVVRDGMVSSVEATATAQARTVATLAEAGRLQPLLEVDSLDRTILQVVDDQGQVVAASAQVSGLGPLTGSVPAPDAPTALTLRIVLPGAPPRDYRVVALPTKTPSGAVTTYAAVSLSDVSKALASLTSLLTGGLAAALAVIGAVTWFVVGRALGPVEAIRAEVDRISSTDLGRRAPVPGSGDEITRLAMTMNRMLDRLEQTVEQQRQLVADVSHEIRSPIASLRTQLEVALAHPDLADWPEVAQGLLDDTERLQALATDLLLLARLDAGERQGAEPLDIRRVVEEVVDRHSGTHGAAEVPVTVTGPSGLVATANRAQLVQIVGNLLDNAKRHALTGVRVAVWAAPGAGSAASVQVEVRNDGPVVPVADRERIFRRFVRLDDARSRDSGGSGLGLPIAREIARAHGGDVTIVDAGDESRFLLTLPRTLTPPPDHP